MKFTIITATNNSEKNIKKNLTSVINQNYQNIEHIFIDNRSSDKTLEILKEYKKKTNYKVIIKSKKDLGLYHAFNKGLSIARGDIITILNSDDYFSSKNCINIILKYFKEDIEFVYGNIKIFSQLDKTKIIRYWKSSFVTIDNFYKIPHPGFCFKRNFQRKYKIKFCTQYKISSDLNFIATCLLKSKYYRYINKTIVHFMNGGTSTKFFNIFLSNYECYKILKHLKINFKFFFIIKKLFFKVKQIIS